MGRSATESKRSFLSVLSVLAVRKTAHFAFPYEAITPKRNTMSINHRYFITGLKSERLNCLPEILENISSISG